MKHVCSMTLYWDGVIIATQNDVYFEYGEFARYTAFTEHIIRIFDKDGFYKGLLAFETGEIRVFTGEEEEDVETFIYNKDGSITKEAPEYDDR